MSEITAAEYVAKLQNYANTLPQDVARALYAEVNVEKIESMRRTPVKTGALRASHEVSKPEVGGGQISVTLSVGGPSAPYAVRVHEDVSVYHANGQAKFLESTVTEAQPHMAERIVKRLEIKHS